MVSRALGLVALQVLGCGLASDVVWARVVLKPNGSGAVPLRVKSVSARVSIEGQFASTTSVTTFANETSQRIEADFLSTVPEGTVVTYFAYWFGEEKVVARIVEKERASAIYQHITSRMRDPALVEMIGRNTFRARIFPVMPNADLKVEMRWVQVLDTTPRGLRYRFPLAPEEAGRGVLDDIDLEVEARTGASGSAIASAGSSYGQPISRQGGLLKTRLKQSSFQPTKDFDVELNHRASTSPPPPLRASLYAAPSAGGDGFFALALTASRDVARPSLKIRGVETHSLAPGVLPAMKAGQRVVVCGRYKGSGAGVVEVAGLGSARVNFGARSENNNLATRLWAARRIEQLSASEKNRGAVLGLSKQFTLPSKWSSWLAVPTEELQRFKQEKIQADLQVLGRRYALEVAQNGEASRRAAALKQQYKAKSAEAGGDYGYSINSQLSSVAQELAQQRAEESAKARPNRKLMASLQRQVNTLTRISGDSSLRDDSLSAELNALSSELVREEVAGRTGRANVLRARMKSVSGRLSYRSRWDYYYQTLRDEKANELAAEYVRSRYEEGDASAAQRASTQLTRLGGAEAARKSIGSARSQWATQRVYDLATQLAEAQSQERPDARQVSELQAKIKRTEAQNGSSLESAQEGARTRWAYQKLPVLASELVKAKYADAPDAERVAKAEASLSRVERAVGSRSRVDYEASSLFGLMSDTQGQYVTELRRERPSRDKLQVLEARMASVYADPKYQGVLGPWTESGWAPNLVPKSQNPLQIPKIAELRRDVYDLDAQLASQPDEVERGILKSAKAEKVERLAYATRYHLRLGDPLIAIDAPRDAQNVVAVMPDGQVKRLLWSEASQRWEARFDIPSHASEGAYRISVIVVRKDGSRQESSVDYSVDMTPPTGKGHALSAPGRAGGRTVRLEVSGSVGTARAFALLPWGEKAELKLSPSGKDRFFALATVPEGHESPKKVTYVLTDRAHNRTTISVDVAR